MSPRTKQLDNHSTLLKDLETTCQETLNTNVKDISTTVEFNPPRPPLEGPLEGGQVRDTTEVKKTRKSFPKYQFPRNYRTGKKGYQKGESGANAISEEKDKFGKHSPKVISPLVLNSRSSTSETKQSCCDYSTVRCPHKQGKLQLQQPLQRFLQLFQRCYSQQGGAACPSL